MMEDGLLLVDKHSGCTSHDIVQQARKLLHQKKIGHCGTLDPSATGLLLLTLGKATRLTRFLIQAPKVYEGRIRFGSETSTYDAQGEVEETFPTDGLTYEAVIAAMKTFVGEIQQLPPRYSAKKIHGKKFYELARRGEEVPREPKPVTVYEFEAISTLEDGTIRFRLSCGSGTYARSLAHDLGQLLGCGGHLDGLRRMQIGDFKVEDSRSLEALEENQEAEEPAPLPGTWIPFDEISMPFNRIKVDAQQEQRIFHGQTLLARDLDGEEGDWVQLLNSRNRFVAVGNVIERIGDRGVGVIQPRVVFH